MSFQKDNCLFCKIISRQIPSYTIYEDDEVISFLDITPVNMGHALVIPKKHFDSFSDMDDASVCKLFSSVKMIANSVVKSVNAPGFNIMINNKKAAGQLIDHVHVHIIPRFEGDGYEHWHGKKLDEAEMKRISQAIVNSLK